MCIDYYVGQTLMHEVNVENAFYTFDSKYFLVWAKVIKHSMKYVFGSKTNCIKGKCIMSERGAGGESSGAEPRSSIRLDINISYRPINQRQTKDVPKEKKQNICRIVDPLCSAFELSGLPSLSSIISVPHFEKCHGDQN